MGLLSKICGRSKHSETQADTPEPSLWEQLVDAQAELARLIELPISAFTPRISSGFITEHSIDRKDNAIAYARADVAELKVKWRLSQQDTRSTKTPPRNNKRMPLTPPNKGKVQK